MSNNIVAFPMGAMESFSFVVGRHHKHYENNTLELTHAQIHLYDVYLQGSYAISLNDDIVEWCKENTKGWIFWRRERQEARISFDNEVDMINFKLCWM